MNPKIGVVDVGGGFRGIYAAGVLDYCMHKGIWFDLGIGVSAGIANLASYCAKQPRRNQKFYTEYGRRIEYMSMANYFHARSYLDLQYIYETLTNFDGECPLYYDIMTENSMEFLTVITDAKTGTARYISKQEFVEDCYTPLMASFATPGVCRPVWICGKPYYDGSLGDPIPVDRAFEWGCDKVVLILTVPENTVRKPGKDTRLARRIRKEFPEAAEALMNRARKYNEGVELAREYAAEGKLLIVAPDDTYGVQTIYRDSNAMERLYRKGYADGEKITPFFLG